MGSAVDLQSALRDLRACCWDTTSCDRPDLAAVEAAAASHRTDGMVVRSCQRTEVYHRSAACDCGAPLQFERLEALQHLAEVAAGLHSVVLGEPEILGQVRAALQGAPSWLRMLGDLAIAAARDVRHEARFVGHSGHILDRALRVAGVPAEGTIAVLGVGQMGRLVASRAHELGFSPVVVVSRREPESRWFRNGGYRWHPLASLRRLALVDVLVGCLGSAAESLDIEGDLPPVRRLVVDLGTPRNFAGESGVPVLTIRDLLVAERAPSHGAIRRSELRQRVAEALARRLSMASEDAGTYVGAFRERVERVRAAEVARIRSLHPDLPEEIVELITKSLVNRLFHEPSERLRRADPALAAELLRLLDPTRDAE